MSEDFGFQLDLRKERICQPASPVNLTTKMGLERYIVSPCGVEVWE